MTSAQGQEPRWGQGGKCDGAARRDWRLLPPRAPHPLLQLSYPPLGSSVGRRLAGAPWPQTWLLTSAECLQSTPGTPQRSQK